LGDVCKYGKQIQKVCKQKESWGESERRDNCRTCVIAFQPTMQRVVVVVAIVIVFLYCTDTMYDLYICAYIFIFGWAFFNPHSPFNWQRLKPAARKRLKLKTFWTLDDAHALEA